MIQMQNQVRSSDWKELSNGNYDIEIFQVFIRPIVLILSRVNREQNSLRYGMTAKNDNQSNGKTHLQHVTKLYTLQLLHRVLMW